MADNNPTTNQCRDQQKWALLVAVIATATAAATTTTQRHDGKVTVTVMDGNGWCNGNTMATMAMEGVMATQWQHAGNGQRDSNWNKWSNGNTTGKMVMDGATTMATAMMDGTMVTAMERAVATRRWQQQCMAQWQCDGNDGDGQRDGDSNGWGNSNGDGRHDGNVTAKTVIGSARKVTAINSTMAM